MYNNAINQFINFNQSNYVTRYKFYTCIKLDENVYKFHYYMRDTQLLQLDFFIEIHFVDGEIVLKCREGAYELDKNAIAIDALKRIQKYLAQEESIHPKDLEAYIDNPVFNDSITPMDMINVLNHIKYTDGKNDESIYKFYTIFFPYVNRLFKLKQYHKALVSIQLLFDEILYEEFWNGVHIVYMDQEHKMHQTYFRSILSISDEYFNELTECEYDLIKDILIKIINYWRFAISIYSSLEVIAKNHKETVKNLLDDISTPQVEGPYLIYETLKAVTIDDKESYRKFMKAFIELLMQDISALANPEDQKDSGLVFLYIMGFDLLIEIFNETYNPSIYKCFPIRLIPQEFKPRIKEQLVLAIQYHAKNMNGDRLLYSLEQISEINTLLIENF